MTSPPMTSPSMSPSLSSPRIRPYDPADLADVVDVCIRTGDGGADATGQRERDSILPDVYAAPYLAFDPGLAFVVDTGERVAGYILGTADTASFVRRYRQEWLPQFIERYGSQGSDGVLAAGLHPERMLVPGLEEYPAHLHIDLLPSLQGQGFGRMLMGTLEDALRARGVAGLHLAADPSNTSAIAFYTRLGFTRLPAPDETGAVLGIRL